jgi:hypothetical protein
MPLDWIFTATAWTLGAAAVLLAAWALLSDRSRGRRRCPKCWYDMAGVPGLQCPECGREVRSHRRLLKTRRRWRWAMLAVFLAVSSYAVSLVPAVRSGGWPSAVPSSILVFVAPVDDSAWKWTPNHFLVPRYGDPTDPLLKETVGRLKSHRLASSQSQVFFDRYFKACPEQLAGVV